MSGNTADHSEFKFFRLQMTEWKHTELEQAFFSDIHVTMPSHGQHRSQDAEQPADGDQTNSMPSRLLTMYAQQWVQEEVKGALIHLLEADDISIVPQQLLQHQGSAIPWVHVPANTQGLMTRGLHMMLVTCYWSICLVCKQSCIAFY